MRLNAVISTNPEAGSQTESLKQPLPPQFSGQSDKESESKGGSGKTGGSFFQAREKACASDMYWRREVGVDMAE